MAASKQKLNVSLMVLWLACLVAGSVLVFVLAFIYYLRYRRSFDGRELVRRVFDMSASWQTLLFVGFLFSFPVLFSYIVWDRNLWFTWLVIIPLLWLANWFAKGLAFVMLGFVVDSENDLLMFPPRHENLDLLDYLLFWRALQKMTTLDVIKLSAVERVSRDRGTNLLLHGDFGSRIVVFSNKLKRDEALYLVTSGSGSARPMYELE